MKTESRSERFQLSMEHSLRREKKMSLRGLIVKSSFSWVFFSQSVLRKWRMVFLKVQKHQCPRIKCLFSLLCSPKSPSDCPSLFFSFFFFLLAKAEALGDELHKVLHSAPLLCYNKYFYWRTKKGSAEHFHNVWCRLCSHFFFKEK